LGDWESEEREGRGERRCGLVVQGEIRGMSRRIRIETD
jgi:hypothetical protein